MHRFISFVIIVIFNITISAITTEHSTVDQLKSYVKEIKSIAIDFEQEDPQGNFTSGKLLIDKPFKFRCNYYTPYPLVIVGNKNYLSVYDYDMDELSRVKAEENIFKFLLMDDIEIEKYFKIENTIIEDNKIIFTLYHYDSDRKSVISFDMSSKQISKMEIIEGDNTTKMKFGLIEQVANFDPDLFILKNPDIYGPPNRLTKSEIEKKYKIIE